MVQHAKNLLTVLVFDILFCFFASLPMANIAGVPLLSRNALFTVTDCFRMPSILMVNPISSDMWSPPSTASCILVPSLTTSTFRGNGCTVIPLWTQLVYCIQKSSANPWIQARLDFKLGRGVRNVSTSVPKWLHLQTVWNQIRPPDVLQDVWPDLVQTVKLSLWRYFWKNSLKSQFWNSSSLWTYVTLNRDTSEKVCNLVFQAKRMRTYTNIQDNSHS